MFSEYFLLRNNPIKRKKKNQIRPKTQTETPKTNKYLMTSQITRFNKSMLKITVIIMNKINGFEIQAPEQERQLLVET